MRNKLFSILLHLYPAAFRDEFGEELLAVFTEKCVDARQSGWMAWLSVWVNELAELPWNLFIEYWLLLRGRNANGGFDMNVLPEKKAVVTILIPFILGIALWILNPAYMNKLFTTSLGLLFIICVVLILAVNSLLILDHLEKARVWSGLLAGLAVLIIIFAPAFVLLINSTYLVNSMPMTAALIGLVLCNVGLLIALIVLVKRAVDIRHVRIR